MEQNTLINWKIRLVSISTPPPSILTPPIATLGKPNLSRLFSVNKEILISKSLTVKGVEKKHILTH